MNRAQAIDLLMLLSALESWSFSAKVALPDYLHDSLSAHIDKLRKQAMEEGK